MINAVSKRKITHYVEPNTKRTLCNLSVAKNNWEFSTVKSVHPHCEACQHKLEKQSSK